MNESGRKMETYFDDSLHTDGEVSPEKDRVDNQGIFRIRNRPHFSGHGKIPAEDFKVGRLGDLEPVFKG